MARPSAPAMCGVPARDSPWRSATPMPKDAWCWPMRWPLASEESARPAHRLRHAHRCGAHGAGPGTAAGLRRRSGTGGGPACARAMPCADPLWPMPLWDGYDDELASRIADLNNAPSSGMAGSITAALFLRRFVADPARWLHLDVYGWNPEGPSRPSGGRRGAGRARRRRPGCASDTDDAARRPSAGRAGAVPARAAALGAVGLHAGPGRRRHRRGAGEEGLCRACASRDVVNLAVAFVSGAPALSNMTSFVWANLAHGRGTHPPAGAGCWPRSASWWASSACRPGRAAGLAFTVLSVIAARVVWAGVLTVRAAVWSANYPRADAGPHHRPHRHGHVAGHGAGGGARRHRAADAA